MAARRGFLKLLGGAIAAAIGLVITVPAAALLTFPTRRRTVDGGTDAVEVAELARLPVGQPVRVNVRVARLRDAWTAFTDVTLGAAWLVRSGDRVRALSTVCPHAGCAVDFSAEAKCFQCPCHDSTFALDGTRLSGPAGRGMDELTADVKDGRVRVAYRRFRQGVSQKEPA
jgi:menaquinol-cytochrome c reductase iron-sulfur subunit